MERTMSAPDDLEDLRGQVSDTLADGLLDPVGGPGAAAQSPDVQSLAPSADDAPFETARLNWGQRTAIELARKAGKDKPLNDALDTITGKRFLPRDIHNLEDRAINNANPEDADSLVNLQPGNPVIVDPQQKAIIDRLMRQSGSDPLGLEAQKAYDEAWRNGRIRLRNK
jgi:hypothetical protein